MGGCASVIWTAAAALSVAMAAPAAADTVRVGLILPYSGVFARLGDTMDNAVRLWANQKGETAGSHKIEIIRRDETGPNPDIVKRIAQELITRDRVAIIAGLVFTPNALSIAPLVSEAKIPTVIMNAATAVVTMRSPYFARVSLTLPQTTEIFGRWAATRAGLRRAYTVVSDYAPGHDAEEAFRRSFTEAGGSIVGSVRFPVASPDFAPFLQRVLDAKPEALYAFIPGGSQPTLFVNEFHQLGLAEAAIRLLPSAEAVDEADLQNLPDAAIGITTATNYSAAYKSAANEAFVAAWRLAYGQDKEPDLFAVGAWDGMALIYDVVGGLGGDFQGDAAMERIKGWAYESPRGPIRIDPDTRDIVQNIYICRVERVEGRLVNRVIETYPAVKDPWKERNKGK
jgi:branched-chain amino acid transport system substrate-binding protein